MTGVRKRDYININIQCNEFMTIRVDKIEPK